MLVRLPLRASAALVVIFVFWSLAVIEAIRTSTAAGVVEKAETGFVGTGQKAEPVAIDDRAENPKSQRSVVDHGGIKIGRLPEIQFYMSDFARTYGTSDTSISWLESVRKNLISDKQLTKFGNEGCCFPSIFDFQQRSERLGWIKPLHVQSNIRNHEDWGLGTQCGPYLNTSEEGEQKTEYHQKQRKFLDWSVVTPESFFWFLGASVAVFVAVFCAHQFIVGEILWLIPFFIFLTIGGLGFWHVIFGA